MGVWTPGPGSTGGDDTFTGDNTNESASGGNGADTLNGGGGNDTLNGDDGDDILNGGLGVDTVNGGAGADTIIYAVGDGNGVMNGGDGADTLIVSDGATDGILNATWSGASLTVLSGNSLSNIESVTANLGGGIDWLVYAAGSAAVSVNLATGSASGFTSVSNIERVVGGGGSDTLTGDGLDNRLDGGAGDDVLSGGGGVDTLIGGDGADAISGGLANDSIQGGAGADAINWTVGDGRDTIDGGADTDTFNATGSASAELGNATWNGSSLTALMDNGLANIEAVNLDLGGGVDWLIYNATAAVTVNLQTGSASGFASVANIEKVIGGAGNDSLTGDGLDNRLDGQGGNDTLNGGAGSDAVLGGDGDDTIYASAGNDSLQGQNGNDTFIWTATDGRDTFNGGADVDTVNLTGAATADVADANWNGTAITGLLNNALVDIESINLDLGAGGSGGDWLRYNTALGIVVNLATGSATGFASITGVENLIGGTGNDTLTGDAGANKINGNTGDDVISGGLGADTLTGLAGNDTFNWTWGDGGDVIDGGADTDTINFTGNASTNFFSAQYDGAAITSAAGVSFVNVEDLNVDLGGGEDWLSYTTTAAVIANLAAGTASGFASIAGIENIIGGSGNDTLTGDANANKLQGGSGDDTLSGGDGDDTLTGGAGADSMTGGAGNDAYYVDDAGDVVSDSSGVDTVYSSVTFSLAGTGADNLYLSGAALNGTGTSGANIIVGNDNNNFLDGSGGLDTLSGMGGDDTLALRGGISSGSIGSINGGSGTDTLYLDASAFAFQYLGGWTISSIEHLSFTAIGSSYVFAPGQLPSNLSLDATNEGAHFVNVYVAPTTTAGAVNIDLSGWTFTDWTNSNVYISGDGYFTADSASADTIIGSTQRDIINTYGGADSVNGNAGNDTINAGAGDNVVSGGDGNDSIQTGAGADTINGDAGDDVINAGAGDDVISGGDGNDNIHGDGGVDTIHGNAGADTIYANDGAAGETLYGDADNDTLYGGGLNDVLDGGTGADNLVGGDGNDSYYVDNAGDVVNDTGPSDTADNVYSSVTFSLVGTGADNLYLSGAALNGTGSSGANIIVGNDNNNVLDGGGGLDTLSGVGGDDTLRLYGGIGNGSTGSIDGGSGTDTLYLDAGGSGAFQYFNSWTIASIEHLSFTAFASNYVFAPGQLASNLSLDATNEGFHYVSLYIARTSGSGGVNIDLSGWTFTDWSGDIYVNGTGLFVPDSASIDIISGSSQRDIIYTYGGNDTIDGNGGNDVINAGAGDDVISGGDGNDNIHGDGGVDTIHGNAGADTIYANDGAAGETLYGDADNDTLYGGGLDDVLDGGTGADNLVGGDGNDSYYVDNAGDVVNDTGPSDTADNVYSSVTFSLVGTGADNLYLSGAALNGTGTSGANIIVGNDNNNFLDGSDGADTLMGGAGVDSVSGGAGNDTLQVITGGHGLSGENYDGGADTDTLLLGDGADFRGAAFTSIEQITFNGTPNTTWFDAEDFGGAGFVDNLSVTSLGGSQIIELFRAGAGTTNVSAWTFSGSVLVRLHGSTGGDTLIGSTQGDVITGGAGNDTLEGGAGNDTLDGEGDTDTASYANASAGVTVNLSTVGAQNTIGAGIDTLSNIESLTGSAHNDTLTGNASANVLAGGAGNDTLTGGAGVDNVSGGAGNDTLQVITGGDGLSGESYDGGADTDTLLLGDGTDFRGAAFTSIEQITFNGTPNTTWFDAEDFGGGGFADNLSVTSLGGSQIIELYRAGAGTTDVSGWTFSGSVQVWLRGSTGADVFYGTTQGDTILGGAGNDTIDGGAGNDTLDGGADTDTLSYANAASGVTVSFALFGSAQNTGGAGIDTINNFENLIGSSFDDTLFGNGNAGTIDGGAGTDTMSYAGVGNYVTVSLALQGTAQDTFAGGLDTLLNFENLTGTSHNDTLGGDGNNNVIDGGAGTDVITGGAGNDTITGGSGADTFVYASGAGADTITDFDADASGGQDLISLTAFGINAGDFGSRVTITDLGSDTLITIDGSVTITLTGVTGDGSNVITQSDFILGP